MSWCQREIWGRPGSKALGPTQGFGNVVFFEAENEPREFLWVIYWVLDSMGWHGDVQALGGGGLGWGGRGRESKPCGRLCV